MGILGRFFNAFFVLHPLHSMTVHFPVALTATSLFFIILALIKQSEILEKVAFFNLSLSAIGTFVAGISGIRDNLIRFDGDAQNANIKIFLALTLFLLTSITTFMRWRKKEILWTPSTMAIVLVAFLLSFLLAATLGFLGGVILYGF